MKRYAVIYKERYKKISKVIGIVIEGYKLYEIRDKFNKEIQEYSIFGEPKYTIVKISVIR